MQTFLFSITVSAKPAFETRGRTLTVATF